MCINQLKKCVPHFWLLLRKVLNGIINLICFDFYGAEGSENEDLVQYWVDRLSDGLVKAERHTVTTLDGYQLIIHRLCEVSLEHSKPRKVVFMQHALLESSFNWIAPGENSLPFLLLKEGHDVWLGNNRGNLFSKCKRSVSCSGYSDGLSCSSRTPKCRCITCRQLGYDSIWRHLLPSMLYKRCKNAGLHQTLQGDWTLMEMAQFDMPAMLSHITQITQQDISCIGVSQGAAQLLLLSSFSPTEVKSNLSQRSLDYINAEAVQSRTNCCSISSTSVPDTSEISPRSFLNSPEILNDTTTTYNQTDCLSSDLYQQQQTHLPPYRISKLILFCPPVIMSTHHTIDEMSIFLYIGRFINSLTSRFVPTIAAILPPMVLSYTCGWCVGAILKLYSFPICYVTLGRIIKHTPSGITSLRNLKLFLNSIDEGANLLTKVCPTFQFHNIRDNGIPVSVYFGRDDNLVDHFRSSEFLHRCMNNRSYDDSDVTDDKLEHRSECLTKRCSSLLQTTVLDGFSHLDFHWLPQKCQGVYEELFRLVKS